MPNVPTSGPSLPRGTTRTVWKPPRRPGRRGLLRNRFVELGGGRLELLLELGNPAPEIGHHVLGKRGHSINSTSPGAWWRRAQTIAAPLGQSRIISARNHLGQRYLTIFGAMP